MSKDGRAAHAPASEHELVIEAGRAERHYWRDLWRYRELFRVLAWRDVAVRYKQTVIGVAWAVIRPFLTMVVFTVVFGKLAKLPTRRRRALSAAGLRRHAAVVPVLDRALSEASNSLDRQRQPDQQGLLPAADHADRGGRRGASSISSINFVDAGRR